MDRKQFDALMQEDTEFVRYLRMHVILKNQIRNMFGVIEGRERLAKRVWASRKLIAEYEDKLMAKHGREIRADFQKRMLDIHYML